MNPGRIVMLLFAAWFGVVADAPSQTATTRPPQTATIGQQSDKESPENKAWASVNGIDVKSVEAFLAAYPSATHAQEARVSIALHQRISEIRKADTKALVVIPFEILGKPWNNWKDPKAEKGILVIWCKENEKGADLGIRYGGALGTKAVGFDAVGLVRAPMADGSILGFDTGGSKAQLAGSALGFSVVFDNVAPTTVAFQSAPGEVLYFVVVHGVGLVHLHGAGKAFMRDGKVIDLKPLQIKR
jgi:hypothetical protein